MSVFLFFSLISGTFQLLYLQIFLQVLSLSSLSGTPIQWMLIHLVLPQESLRLSSFIYIILSPLLWYTVMISAILFSRSLICCFTSLILLLILSNVFYFIYCSATLFFSTSSSLLIISCIFLILTSIIFQRPWIILLLLLLFSCWVLS